jgi:uncharacterized protein YqjF (DUF2071 family)
MAQSWHDLLFMHWPVPAEAVRGLVPEQLELDLWNNQAWVAVVPFWMSGVRARGLPAIPGLSQFPELNVRTYVRYGTKPGVYFFSLDAGSLPAVWSARALYHLPYFPARMSAKADGDAVSYESKRAGGGATFLGHYGPSKAIEMRRAGTIEHWFTERYCLFTEHRGAIYIGEIHHVQWPLQDAWSEIEYNTMASAAGITLPQTLPLLNFARRIDVLIWPIQRVGRV